MQALYKNAKESKVNQIGRERGHLEPQSDHNQSQEDAESFGQTSHGFSKINLNQLVKKPRYFNGESPPPSEWIDEYQDAMEDNCWSEITGIYYFKHFLKDDAASWFKLQAKPKLNANSSWQDLYKLFEENYLGRAERDRLTRNTTSVEGSNLFLFPYYSRVHDALMLLPRSLDPENALKQNYSISN